MKAVWKKRLIVWLSLTAAMVLLVEFNKYMKRQAPVCEDGSCPLPLDHGLIIDPFPDEIAPAQAVIKQTNKLETDPGDEP
jgi:hypothetical protein